MTEYEALQQQRSIERSLRRWKRENMAMKAAGLDTTESAAKIARWQGVQKDFINQTGLKRQAERESIAGWGRSQASRATAHVKEAQRRKSIRDEADAINKAIKDSGNPKKLVGLPDAVLSHTVNVIVDKSTKLPYGFQAIAPNGVVLTKLEVQAGAGTSTPIKDLPRLCAEYPKSDFRQWQKKSGTAYGKSYHYVIHWYENNGYIPVDEIKLKGMKQNQ